MLRSFLFVGLCVMTLTSVTAFAPPSARGTTFATTTVGSSFSSETSLKMMDVGTIQQSVSAAQSTGMLLAETEAWVQPLASVLDPFLNLFSFAMLCRIVISWYPKTNLNELPFNIVVWPTEPLLKAIRGSVPPAFGVDITPIVWLAIFTFFHEILLGQQGLLTMKIKYGI
mmetsp:Transcript_21164/g.29921  ORF Transcript_21164/g.29921 Transcript_21164/m.29921 type:complete len:170 (+) Transcript_21164:147-656(+)